MICNIQPVFVVSSVPETKYRRDTVIENDPVNISLCIRIYKGKIAWYPDNDGIPAIKFKMLDGAVIEWAYNGIYEDHNYIDHTSNRDLDYDYLMKKFGTEIKVE